MALERLSLAPAPVDGGDSANGRQVDGGDDGNKAPRLPRWTRQEILVLIQGKRVAENRVRRGRTAGLAFGTGQVEPKWASVSSYCKRHGVNRGPVQCRKRWSNLAGDYKKIREWESQIKEETESFWVMRNDLRREKKLPGFFDREVYDILDGGGGSSSSTTLALALAPFAEVEEGKEGEDVAAAAEDVEVEAEAAEPVFDSGRSAAADDGLFSDFEQAGQDELGAGIPDKELPKMSVPVVAAPIPISEKQYQPFSQGCPGQGSTHEKQPASYPDAGNTQEGRKRKRFAADGDEETTYLQHQLVEALEKNGRLLNSQLEAQNTNFELDREQRKDHGNSLIAVLNKLADALGKIADKL